MSGLMERALLVALALAAVYVALVPLNHASDATSRPDLLFCLVLAWAARRPAATSLLLVIAFGLMADIVLARPPGLGALGLLLAAETIRRRPPASAPAEWLTVGLLFAGVLAGSALLLALTLAPLPDPGALAGHWLATVASYPLVAGLVALVLRRRPEAAG